MSEANFKIYLGDSVYAEIDKHGMIKLTTDNGYGASNTIYLEKEVYDNLVKFHDKFFLKI
jgi:hypothetical protein